MTKEQPDKASQKARGTGVDEWHPVSEAPHDGRWIRLRREGDKEPFEEIARFNNADGYWIKPGGGAIGRRNKISIWTHWQNLQPPSAEPDASLVEAARIAFEAAEKLYQTGILFTTPEEIDQVHRMRRDWLKSLTTKESAR